MAVFSQGYAVVVGIAGYHESVGPLFESVLNDARDVAALLTDPERCGYPKEQVKLLLDGEASHKGLLAALDGLAETAPKDATAIFYFSGHGFRMLQEKVTYLAPHDARFERHQPLQCLRTPELMTRLRAIKSDRVVVILDCCHAASAAEVKGSATSTSWRPLTFKRGPDESFLETLGQGRGRAVLASCTADQSSLVESGQRNSLFTIHLCEALAGSGLPQGKTEIGVLDVFGHLCKTVPVTSRGRQNPVLKAEMESNFALALRPEGCSPMTEDERRKGAAAEGARGPLYSAEALFVAQRDIVIDKQIFHFGGSSRRRREHS